VKSFILGFLVKG